MTMMVTLLVLFSFGFHLHASSNPVKVIHSFDTSEELAVHKSGVNPVVRRGGGGGGHGGGSGGHGGGGGGHGGILGGGHDGYGGESGGHGGGGWRGSSGDPGLVIPVYAGGHRTPRTHHGRINGEHNSKHFSQLVATILALVQLLTYCF